MQSLSGIKVEVPLAEQQLLTGFGHLMFEQPSDSDLGRAQSLVLLAVLYVS